MSLSENILNMNTKKNTYSDKKTKQVELKLKLSKNFLTQLSVYTTEVIMTQ